MSKTILFCLCVLLATATLARAAVGVGRIHLDADFDGDLDGFEHQRLALTLRRLYPGHAAAHSRGGQQSLVAPWRCGNNWSPRPSTTLSLRCKIGQSTARPFNRRSLK